jgi:hypothetical protein
MVVHVPVVTTTALAAILPAQSTPAKEEKGLPLVQFLVPNALMLAPMGSPKDQARFSQAFGTAWRQIGDAGFAADHETLTAHWTQGGSYSLVQLDDPSLWDQRAGPACAKFQGRVLRFDSGRVFNFVDPSWLVLVIAHDVAHAFLYACRESIHCQQPPADPTECLRWDAERERLAEQTMQRWGFDMQEYRVLLTHTAGDSTKC